MIKIIQFIYNKISFLVWSLRTGFWKIFFKEVWNNTTIMKNCFFYSPRWIKLWKNCFININCILDWKGWIEMWDDVSLAPNVRIWTFNHNYWDTTKPINIQWNNYAKVIIWNNVWIWDGSIILPWVNIWEWSIIAAWSIVTKNVKSFAIVWWNPAKLIKKRK
jgi:acetyltransferase-like isoleucine patch superfamily enzyme